MKSRAYWQTFWWFFNCYQNIVQFQYDLQFSIPLVLKKNPKKPHLSWSFYTQPRILSIQNLDIIWGSVLISCCVFCHSTYFKKIVQLFYIMVVLLSPLLQQKLLSNHFCIALYFTQLGFQKSNFKNIMEYWTLRGLLGHGSLLPLFTFNHLA